MRAAFLVSRRPWFQLLGPTMLAAREHGWDVECWHDYRQPSDGAKGYQFPALDSADGLTARGVQSRACHSTEELSSWLARTDLDALVSLRTSQLPAPANGARGPLLVEQQHVLDTFVVQRASALLTRDLISIASPWWINWAASWYAQEREIDDLASYERAVLARCAAVGMPALDVAREIDQCAVRARWGIPASQPVVVLFPFPAGVGQEAFWPKHIFAEASVARKLARIIRHGRYEYLPDVWRRCDDANVVAALRRFCDLNGAYLLVKARQKTPVPHYLEAAADRCVYDEHVYPGTVFEALSIASLSVGHFTTAAIESVALGIPHLCIPFSADHYFPASATMNIRSFEHFFSTAEGGPFQFTGASTVMTVPDVLARLGQMDLSAFRMEEAARRRYVEKFVSHADGRAGERLVSAMAAAVTARRQES